jgi:glycosyltransferase involved in cell wall biosynthesis
VTPTTRGNACRQSSWWRLLFGLENRDKVQDVFVFAFLPGQRWVPAIRRLNLGLARWFIRWALAGCEESRRIQWCYWPAGYELARQIGLSYRIVFDADNDILACPALNSQRASIQATIRDCAEHAEAVVCASAKFLGRCAQLGIRRPTFLRNGVDTGRFERRAEEPSDLQGIPHPRLGYVGTISQWIDYGLVLDLARSNPWWNLVFIGDPYLIRVPEALTSMSNLHFLGARSAQQVPAYLRYFDVGLVPYRRGAGSNSDGDSMKMFEYLAAGLPVVSTDFNGRLGADFEGLIEIAADSVDFSDVIGMLLNVPKESRRDWEARRHDFLERNTWRRRADEAVAMMQTLAS